MQDREGRGPWRPGFSHLWVQDRPDLCNLPPVQAEFGKTIFTAPHTWEYAGCGCPTLKQLRRWFTKKEYKILLGYGYRVVMIDIGRILAQSEIQCVFARSKPLYEDVKIVALY